MIKYIRVPIALLMVASSQLMADGSIKDQKYVTSYTTKQHIYHITSSTNAQWTCIGKLGTTLPITGAGTGFFAGDVIPLSLVTQMIDEAKKREDRDLIVGKPITSPRFRCGPNRNGVAYCMLGAVLELNDKSSGKIANTFTLECYPHLK